MGQHVLPGNPPVTLSVKKSARARRISLRVSRLDGRVTLTLPRGVPEREALDFAQEKADWLRAQLVQRPEDVWVGYGSVIPLRGEMVRILPESGAGSGRGVRREGDALLVSGSEAQCAARLAGYLKTAARDALSEASDRYAALLGKGYNRITLRDTRSRWGSCSSSGGLMYSWRLIMAPAPVLDYVAAHEVAHLAQMNHSDRFWAEVTRIHGPYAAPRRWLRDQGGALHRYRFGD